MTQCILNVGLKYIGFKKKHRGLKKQFYYMYIYLKYYRLSVKNSNNYRKLLQIMHSIKYGKFCVYYIKKFNGNYKRSL